MIHALEMYGLAAVALVLAAILFLIVLARRYAVTGPRPTRTVARAARRKG